MTTAPPSTIVVNSASEMLPPFPRNTTKSGLPINLAVRDGRVYVNFHLGKWPNLFKLSTLNKEPWNGWIPLTQALALPGFQSVVFQGADKAKLVYDDGVRQAMRFKSGSWNVRVDTTQEYARARDAAMMASLMEDMPDHEVAN